MTWNAKDFDLVNIPIGKRQGMLPKHLLKILEVSKSLGLNPSRVWIYGSRARGDARENSDFDLAFEVTQADSWSQFVTGVQDDPPALYKYDLVDIKKADKSLADAILREGILIYESR